MIGKTKIELFNAKTGKRELCYEKKNLITNAVEHAMAMRVRHGVVTTDWFGDLATRSLGGLLLFDKNLTEDAENIEWPNAICVGYANQESHNDPDTKRGILNSNESCKLENGYKNVWDFSTSQANGTIRAVCLTNYYVANNPFARLVYNGGNYGGSECVFLNNFQRSNVLGPLYYDENTQYLYWYCWLADYKNIYKTKFNPYNINRLQDWISRDFPYLAAYRLKDEVVCPLPDLILGSTNYNTDADFWALDGDDGYFYWVYFYKATYGDPKANTGSTSIIVVRKIKYSDESYAVSSPQTYTLTDVCLYNISVRTRRTNNGYLYWVCGTANDPAIYIINLHDFSDVLKVPIGLEDETVDYDYIYLYDFLSKDADGVSFAYRYYNAAVSTTRYWRCAIIHSNGVVDYAGYRGAMEPDWYTFRKFNGILCGGIREVYYTNWPGIGSVNLPGVIPFQAYLGSINNLELPITKTDQQTMKISYALLDTPSSGD